MTTNKPKEWFLTKGSFSWIVRDNEIPIFEGKTPICVIEKCHYDEATFHHIKSHKHHPEFWDLNMTIDNLNRNDRDEPASEYIVDGTRMPLTYVASMVADWFAMSEELGGHPKEWADKNINIRWKFNDNQIRLIYDLIQRVWDEE